MLPNLRNIHTDLRATLFPEDVVCWRPVFLYYKGHYFERKTDCQQSTADANLLVDTEMLRPLGERQRENIGTQSVQELFFFVIGAFVELFTVMILFKFFGCDAQQERNCT